MTYFWWCKVLIFVVDFCGEMRKIVRQF